MNDDRRAPQAFIIEDDKPVKAAKSGRLPAALDIEFATEPEPNLVVLPQTKAGTAPRRMRWGTILLSAVTALLVMWAGTSITTLVQSFFAQSPVLGWLAFALAAIAAFAAIAIVLREAWGIYRLNQIEAMQELAARAINLDDKPSADTALVQIKSLYEGRSDLATAMVELQSHNTTIMDPRDRMRLAERLLVAPLDERARQIIAKRARRVTLLTTVTPAAALDILFVAAQNFAMLREIATLFGGRPSLFATFKLGRMVLTHLAVAGGLALSDTFLQHFVGKGLLGRLSARFGEGAINGILTSRIGLAAAAVCRPIPRDSSSRNELATLLREIVSPQDNSVSEHAKQSESRNPAQP